MSELNEESLRNAIHNLPVHKAGDYVWEEIRWQLEKPLVAELPVHTAPVGAWKGIAAASPVSGLSVSARLTLAVGFILLMASLLFIPFGINENPVNKKEFPRQKGGNPDIHQEPLTAAPVYATEKEESTFISDDENKSGNESPEKRSVLSETLVNLTVNPGSTLMNERTMTISGILPKNSGNVENPGSDITGTISARNDNPYECSSFYSKRPALFLKADYEPEYFSNRMLTPPGQNISLSAGYQFKRLKVALGAGYNRINGNTQLNYSFRRNELIYSYDYVDSVYVDPVSHETYYFTVKVDVYDSIDHTSTQKIVDRYSYVQFPLTISYQVAEFRKFSLHLQAFGAYHLFRENFRKYDAFYEASSRLVSSSIDGQRLTSDYWTAGAGLMLEYRVGERLGIDITPRLKYNFMEVSGSAEKKTGSFGLSFGIYYKLIPD
ncbi:MAG: hypothetical protein FD166_2132 [Bacteroidetes bacterium]|nr:MAG: hypothetical protein FD166_2132 [Bacteroidota bacterium]